MKQIFDWLREQFDKQSINGISENGLVVTSFIHSKIAKLCIDEAEAKWEAECCEWFERYFEDSFYYSHDGKEFDYKNDVKCWKYCPYCGKPIKISEVE